MRSSLKPPAPLHHSKLPAKTWSSPMHIRGPSCPMPRDWPVKKNSQTDWTFCGYERHEKKNTKKNNLNARSWWNNKIPIPDTLWNRNFPVLQNRSVFVSMMLSHIWRLATMMNEKIPVQNIVWSIRPRILHNDSLATLEGGTIQWELKWNNFSDAMFAAKPHLPTNTFSLHDVALKMCCAFFHFLVLFASTHAIITQSQKHMPLQKCVPTFP